MDKVEDQFLRCAFLQSKRDTFEHQPLQIYWSVCTKRTFEVILVRKSQAKPPDRPNNPTGGWTGTIYSLETRIRDRERERERERQRQRQSQRQRQRQRSTEPLDCRIHQRSLRIPTRPKFPPHLHIISPSTYYHSKPFGGTLWRARTLGRPPSQRDDLQLHRPDTL